MAETGLQKCADEIDKAQRAVNEAEHAYRKGGSLAAFNKANDRLAQAHTDFYEDQAGLVPNGGNVRKWGD